MRHIRIIYITWDIDCTAFVVILSFNSMSIPKGISLKPLSTAMKDLHRSPTIKCTRSGETLCVIGGNLPYFYAVNSV